MSAQAGLALSFFSNKGQVNQFGYKAVIRKRTNGSSTEAGVATYLRHFRLYESIMSKFMYIEGLIVDGGGMIQRFGFQPGDLLEIQIYKDESDSDELKIIKEFVFEQIGGQRRDEGQKSTQYTFRAVSKVGFNGLRNKIKKVYSKKAHEVAKSIAKEYLMVPPKEIKDFTETFGELHYIAPSVSPLEALEHVSLQSISAENPNHTNFFFYETRDGVYYRSLDKIIQSANAFPYILNADKNRSENAANDYFRVQELVHHQSVDQREKLLEGGLKNKAIIFNPISRRVDESIFNLKEEYKDIIKLGEYLLMDNEEIDHYVGEERVTDEEPGIFVRCSDECYDQPQDFISSAYGVRTAQKNLMNQTPLTVTLIGNPRLKAGDIIELTVTQASGEEKGERDFVLSGKFLVASCAHSVTDIENYVTICDLFKDSYERSITDYRRDLNSHFVKPRA
ncbi:hypothetical protein OAU13_00990 [bacterium]|nr:hypothetical protein [bacterium]